VPQASPPLAPPSAPQPQTLQHFFAAEATYSCLGTIDDFDAARLKRIQNNFATAYSLPARRVEVTIRPASILVTVLLLTPTEAEASAITRTLAAQPTSASAALLSLPTAQVEAAPTIRLTSADRLTATPTSGVGKGGEDRLSRPERIALYVGSALVAALFLLLCSWWCFCNHSSAAPTGASAHKRDGLPPDGVRRSAHCGGRSSTAARSSLRGHAPRECAIGAIDCVSNQVEVEGDADMWDGGRGADGADASPRASARLSCRLSMALGAGRAKLADGEACQGLISDEQIVDGAFAAVGDGIALQELERMQTPRACVSDEKPARRRSIFARVAQAREQNVGDERRRMSQPPPPPEGRRFSQPPPPVMLGFGAEPTPSPKVPPVAGAFRTAARTSIGGHRGSLNDDLTI